MTDLVKYWLLLTGMMLTALSLLGYLYGRMYG